MRLCLVDGFPDLRDLTDIRREACEPEIIQPDDSTLLMQSYVSLPDFGPYLVNLSSLPAPENFVQSKHSESERGSDSVSMGFPRLMLYCCHHLAAASCSPGGGGCLNISKNIANVASSSSSTS